MINECARRTTKIRRKLLVNTCGETVVRIVPMLIVVPSKGWPALLVIRIELRCLATTREI